MSKGPEAKDTNPVRQKKYGKTTPAGKTGTSAVDETKYEGAKRGV